ncbi:hypothetical protein ACFXOS_17795 [Streptomyces sp. NPDC059175]|uniref:hypothetical protein n=1 Tax=Streptomyces sp. NPDC059175 TaxID=3346757 RepID=UPI003691E85D
MKPSAARTFGAAVLGAAFAAAAAGTASAAPRLPDVGTPVHALPAVQNDTFPAVGQVAQQAAGREVLPDTTTNRVTGLVGGLPPRASSAANRRG